VILGGLGLLFATTTVAVHVDELKGVSLDTSLSLTAAIARAIEREAHFVVRVEDPDWPACSGEKGCAESIRMRLQADQVLGLRVLGGATLMRVVATLAGMRVPSTAKVDIPKDPSAWEPVIHELVSTLFGTLYTPEPPRIALPVTAPEPSARSISPVPCVLIGAGAISLGVGIGFAWSGAKARARLRQEFLTDDAYEDLRARGESRTLTGEVLIGVAISSALAGLAYVLIDQ
jgi:hypothetical protein